MFRLIKWIWGWRKRRMIRRFFKRAQVLVPEFQPHFEETYKKETVLLDVLRDGEFDA